MYKNIHNQLLNLWLIKSFCAFNTYLISFLLIIRVIVLPISAACKLCIFLSDTPFLGERVSGNLHNVDKRDLAKL